LLHVADDWKTGASAESIAALVGSRIEEGSIVLLHDGARYSGKTASALPDILNDIERKGLQAVAVTDLLGERRQGAWSPRAGLRSMQDRREERFDRERGLIHCGSSGLLRLEKVEYRGPGVTLRSGLAIAKGAPIVELHLDSRKIAEYLRDPPIKARIRMFRDAGESFNAIGKWMREDAYGQKVMAVHSVTMLDREMMHFGFEVLPLAPWPWIFVGIHMKWLSYLYRDERNRTQKTDRKAPRAGLTPRQAWMSREEFSRRFPGEP
jgi:hypothetical protein